MKINVNNTLDEKNLRKKTKFKQMNWRMYIKVMGKKGYARVARNKESILEMTLSDILFKQSVSF